VVNGDCAWKKLIASTGSVYTTKECQKIFSLSCQ